MYGRRIVQVAAAVTLGGALYYFYGGHAAPEGQPPLTELTPQTFASFRDNFNAAATGVRVVMLLSPT